MFIDSPIGILENEQKFLRTEEELILRRRRRRLILSKVPECLTQKIATVHFAYSRKDLEEAFHLVYKRYNQVGLISKNNSEVYFTPYQFFPDSRVCIARDIKTKEVTSTATLVIDSPVGLPSDRIYKDIIDQLRKPGRKLAEYTCLAAVPDIYTRNGLFYVFRLLGRYALMKGITDIVVSIHPKHVEFYEQILLFKNIGPLRYYEGLKNAPAILEYFDFSLVSSIYYNAYCKFEEGKIIYNFFFKEYFDEDLQEITNECKISSDTFRYFFNEQRLSKLPKDIKTFLLNVYNK